MYLKQKLSRGFTLIELLVVIAIIGILASVVLASLNTARNKGGDAAVKSNLSNMRAQAEIQYDSMGCYTNTTPCNGSIAPAARVAAVCPTAGPTVFAQTQIAEAIAGALEQGGLSSCSSTAGGSAWAIVGQYKSDVNLGWCVDSTGKSKQVVIADTGTQGDVNDEVSAGACVE